MFMIYKVVNSYITRTVPGTFKPNEYSLHDAAVKWVCNGCAMGLQ
jgi:hypothetical protein